MKTISSFSALTAWLSRPVILFWAMPWLMVLLVIGTVAQKYVGLYVAQKTFFSSFVFWLGPLPLPGGYMMMGIIFVCLLAKFISESRWSWHRAGIILTHFGALVLLSGGLVTAITAREGFIVIDEGAESAVVEDYHTRVLTILKDNEEIFSLPQKQIRAGQMLGLDEGLPFNVKILSSLIHGIPEQRKENEQESDLPLRGPAAKIQMKAGTPEILDENNHGALSVAIRGTGSDTDGIYLMTEIMPIYPQVEVKNHIYELRFTKAKTTLPFSLALSDVEKDSYPGMDMARAYRSVVTIKDQGTTWPAEISMNNPLRYRGYTFYQSSYIQTPQGETTILSVVWNAGRLFPYVASVLISLGLILHLIVSLQGRRIATFLVVFASLGTGSVQAADLNMADFRMIPVLHEGRLKPLETFAKAELRMFSGKAALNDMPADEWLAELLFDPATASERPIFSIRNRDILTTLRLNKQPGYLYSFGQVAAALSPQAERIQALLQTPPDRLEARQKALLDLHHKASDYMQLMRSFSLVLPLAVMPPETLLTPQEKDLFAKQAPDYLALRKLEERATHRLQEIIRKRGKDPEAYNDEEKSIAVFSWQLKMFSSGSENNNLFRVIPVSWDHEERISPWAVIQSGQGSPATAALLEQWKTLGQAWLDQNPETWNKASHDLRNALTTAQTAHFHVETLYNKANPFQWSLALYALAIMLFMAFHTRGHDVLFKGALLCLELGAFIHICGLAARIYILSRPPVGTLYESLLFVSLICVITGTFLCWKRQDSMSGLAAALSGIIILTTSLYFGAQSGDSLSMLVAVLNTNFWLATHVLVVTSGYGLSILAAMLAHAWLYERTNRSGLFVTMHRMALAALLFTAVGTILGGIWADQSWGRFWGWDPKENGALLIVLWILWLLHGRMAGKLTSSSYAAGIAGLNMVVALAWFGVNLLSVGLHSYGFTSGIATGLSAFCATEIILILILYRRRNSHV